MHFKKPATRSCRALLLHLAEYFCLSQKKKESRTSNFPQDFSRGWQSGSASKRSVRQSASAAHWRASRSFQKLLIRFVLSRKGKRLRKNSKDLRRLSTPRFEITASPTTGKSVLMKLQKF